MAEPLDYRIGIKRGGEWREKKGEGRERRRREGREEGEKIYRYIPNLSKVPEQAFALKLIEPCP
jgi:hypothetical protein